MRKIFGIPSPPPTALHIEAQPTSPPKGTQEREERRTHVLPLSQILAPQTPPPQLKRERHGSEISETSDDDDVETRLHAAGFLLNLASPGASSRPSSENNFPSRKRIKSRYAESLNLPFSQMVRPAYEYMTEHAMVGGVRYIQNPYSAPNSPPQSPPESFPRHRARPYVGVGHD